MSSKGKTFPIINDEVVLYQRAGTRAYWVRYRINAKEWRRESTGERDYDAAKSVALERYHKAKQKTEQGVVLHATGKAEVTLADVAGIYRDKLAQDLAAGVGKVTYSTYINIINRSIIPFFSDKSIHLIGDEEIEQWDRWNRERIGKEPAKSTINAYNVTLRGVFKQAIKSKLVSSGSLPVLTTKDKGRKALRRPAFTEAEIAELTKELASWSKSGRSEASHYKRRLMFYYIIFLQKTGVRPGMELKSLCWKHIDENFINQYDGERYIHITMPHRKTMEEDFILATQDLDLWLEQIRKHTGNTKPDDLVFCKPDGSPQVDFSHLFAAFLDEVGMRKSSTGRNRSLYSFRHSFATKHLDVMDKNTLAEHMGTSPQMIDMHYWHVDKEKSASKYAKGYFSKSNQVNTEAEQASLEEQLNKLDKEELVRMLSEALKK